jgi:hypothetical protein
MIFDLTHLEGGPTQRFKPRNKVSCEGRLWCRGYEIGSLGSLAVAYTPQTSIVGGQFSLEWHRYNHVPPDPLEIRVALNERGNQTNWKIHNVQLIVDGVPLGITSLADIIGKTVTFFATGFEKSTVEKQDESGISHP